MPQGVLFVHSNFPAQFGDLARTLVARGVTCHAVGGEHAPGVAGVTIARYRLSRGTAPGIAPLAIRAEADLIRGEAAYNAAKALKQAGADPQVIVGHPGWGETVMLDEVFPSARQALLSEFWYRGRGLDIGYDPEFSPGGEEAILRGKAKNAVMGLALTDADAIIAPTEFQRAVLPPAFRERCRVIHEGVDVEAIRPGRAAPFALDDGGTLQPGTPVITHINNQMEPLRGLHIFARALPRLLEAVPDAHVLVIGEARTSGYGAAAPGGGAWKDVCFQGVIERVDPARLHFLGKVPHARMLAALQISTAHVYYSYPFVLSWSLVEAMASGCYVIGSDTAPLRDAIQDGVNGTLLPFFDVDALSQALIAACRRPAAVEPLRIAARETAVASFSRAKGREGWIAALRELGLDVPA